MKLRKFGALFLALALTLSLCAVPATAAESDFVMEDGVLAKYTGAGGAVVIPKSVTEIGEGTFRGCTELTSITIPNSVTKINDGAFYGCTGLTSVTIPGSVTIIGSSAFRRCTGLTSATMLNGVTEIGYLAFMYCTELTSVTIPGSVTKIPDQAFEGCAKLTNVTIQDGVTGINSSAFEDTPWMKNLGEFAIISHILFRYQGAGGAVTIPAGVTKIGDRAFFFCSELTEIIIPDSVTTIGEEAFSDCAGLTSVTIPDSVTKIGNNAIGTSVMSDDRPNLTIYGGAGSAAQRYAKENGISFVVGKAATAAPQTVLVDGKEVQFTAYALKDAAGNMTNYFRVRDVASVLNSTAAQFAVTWDGAVNLQAGAAYTADGSEMTTPFAGNQPYKQVAGDTLVSGAPKKLSAITLTDAKGNGYTYYKLRDLGDNLGFKVDWNGKNVTIDTTAH